MNILAPIDFSKHSVNAARWALSFLKDMGGGELQLIHCINSQMRAEMFNQMDGILLEKAREDLEMLSNSMSVPEDNVVISSQVVLADPKSYIEELSSQNGYDFIITGSKGLTALKDMTVGSVTEYLINNSSSNIITIPVNTDYVPLKNILLGVDDKLVEDSHLLDPLKRICNNYSSKLYMVHVNRKGDSIFEYDPAMDIYLEGIDYEYKSLQYEKTVADTLNEYADYIKADALCMIHRKKNWFQLLFNLSTTKAELFRLDRPLIVINYEEKEEN